MDMIEKLQVVVETPEFIRCAKSCMNEAVIDEFIHYIAANPEAGKIITSTGGARKVRWASDENQGKRGGVRVIYYYHNVEMPIFLFTVYAKNQKESLKNAEKSALKQIIKQLVNTYES